MKKFIIALCCVFAAASAKAQMVNDTPIKDIDVEYMQIIGKDKALSNRVDIILDFGQVDKFWKGKDAKVTDKNGNVITFNSMIDALNFFSQNGYVYEDNFVIDRGSGIQEYTYILKREDK